MDKNLATEIELKATAELDETIAQLIGLREAGQNVFIVFNDIKLYSADVTEDLAYMQVVGMNKVDYDAAVAKEIEAYRAHQHKQAIDKRLATEVELAPGSELDETIEKLMAAGDRGENIFVMFNNHPLYSADVTPDSAYIQITGMNKAEYDLAVAKDIAEYEAQKAKRQSEATATIPEWIERGKKIIFPERHAQWEQVVTARTNGLYIGEDLETALVAMEQIQAGATVEQIKELFANTNFSGGSWAMVGMILVDFCPKGPEFYTQLTKEELSESMMAYLENKRVENEQLASQYPELAVDGNQR